MTRNKRKTIPLGPPFFSCSPSETAGPEPVCTAVRANAAGPEWGWGCIEYCGIGIGVEWK
jgi:hypothetical protein